MKKWFGREEVLAAEAPPDSSEAETAAADYHDAQMKRLRAAIASRIRVQNSVAEISKLLKG